jgi:pimeloyl-ACP methyl ester carboxylesterase
LANSDDVEFSLAEKDVIFKRSCGNIVGKLMEVPNSRGLVILVHGFTGNMEGPSGLFRRFAFKLGREGYSVFRFNFRYTDDKMKDFYKMALQSEVDDLHFIIDALAEKYCWIAIVAESLGGAVSLLVGHKAMKCLVLWYPVIFPSNLAKRWNNPELKEVLKTRGVAPCGDDETVFVSKQFIDKLHSTDVISKLSELTCPVLFVHGDSDVSVSCDESTEGYKAAKTKKSISIIHGANHCFHNTAGEEDKNFQDVAFLETISWLEKFAPPQKLF